MREWDNSRLHFFAFIGEIATFSCQPMFILIVNTTLSQSDSCYFFSTAWPKHTAHKFHCLPSLCLISLSAGKLCSLLTYPTHSFSPYHCVHLHNHSLLIGSIKQPDRHRNGWVSYMRLMVVDHSVCVEIVCFVEP